MNKPSDVIIVCKGKITRVTQQQYDDVMRYMAGQMIDQVIENMKSHSIAAARAEKTEVAFWALQAATS